MKCQILFSWKNKKNITNLSSVEFVTRVVNIKEVLQVSSGTGYKENNHASKE